MTHLFNLLDYDGQQILYNIILMESNCLKGTLVLKNKKYMNINIRCNILVVG
jgi:hypothetical protein